MYDYRKLRGQMTEHYGTFGKLAKAINMGTTTLHSRLDGNRFFDQTEIETIAKMLNLNSNGVNDVFYSYITVNRLTDRD